MTPIPSPLRRALAAGAALLLLPLSAGAEETRDAFYWMNQMNRASAVTLHAGGVLTDAQAAIIAQSIETLDDRAAEPGFPRSGYYLGLEPRMIEIGGEEVTRLHSGRSTIDMGRSNLRLQQRDLLLDLARALAGARAALLDFAARDPDAILPAYTLGVQAQPTTLGHWASGYAGVLERHAGLLRDTYDNVNHSPMGSAVLGTSSYDIDRQLLSDLLGFAAPIHNSFDSVQLATLEANARIGGMAAALALTVSQLTGDLAAQYRFAQPYITFPVAETGASSIMPQKLNPTGINAARQRAGDVLGDVMGYQVSAIKSTSGDTDVIQDGTIEALAHAIEMTDGIAHMFEVFEFHADRALEETLKDYGTATELANMLQRAGGLPFRTAHHVAAAVVQFGRLNGLRASEIPYSEFRNILDETVSGPVPGAGGAGLTEAEFRAALDPRNMVESSLGLGGPRAAEVAGMIADRRQGVAADRDWIAAQAETLDAARARLAERFEALKD